MGVEARRYDDEIGREVLDAREDRDLHRLAESFAPVAGAQGGVDDLIVLASNEPGDIEVSSSMAVCPCVGVAARIASI